MNLRARRLGPILALLLLPAAVQAQVTEVGGGTQRATTSGNAAAPTLAFPADVAANSLLVIGGGAWSNPTWSATGSGAGCSGTTFTALNPGTAATRAAILYGIASGSGPCTVTVSFGGSSKFFSFHIDEFSGVDTTTPLDATGAYNQLSGVTSGSSAVTTASANALVLVYAAYDGPSGLTFSTATQIGVINNNGSAQSSILGFELATSATTYTEAASFSSGSNNIYIGTIAFKAAAGGGGGGTVPVPMIIGGRPGGRVMR